MQFRKGVSCVKVMYRSSSPKGQRQRGWNVFLSGFQSTCSWPGLLPQPRHSAHGPLLIAARMDNLQLAFHQSQRVLCDILYFLRGRGVVLLGLHFHDLRGHGIFPGHPLNCSYDSAGPGPTDCLSATPHIILLDASIQSPTAIQTILGLDSGNLPK